MAAQVEGVSRVAGGVERRGKASVAGGMFGEAVGDLHDRPGRPSGSQRRPRRRTPSSARKANSFAVTPHPSRRRP